MPKNDGGPAFPHPVNPKFGVQYEVIDGMSLRDYAWIHAPPIIAGGEVNIAKILTHLHGKSLLDMQAMALITGLERDWRNMFADAMLAEREKNDEG